MFVWNPCLSPLTVNPAGFRTAPSRQTYNTPRRKPNGPNPCDNRGPPGQNQPASRHIVQPGYRPGAASPVCAEHLPEGGADEQAGGGSESQREDQPCACW